MASQRKPSVGNVAAAGGSFLELNLLAFQIKDLQQELAAAVAEKTASAQELQCSQQVRTQIFGLRQNSPGRLKLYHDQKGYMYRFVSYGCRYEAPTQSLQTPDGEIH